MTRAPRHEQEDDGLRLGRIMRALGASGLSPTESSRLFAVRQQLGQRNRAQTDAALLQKPAAADSSGVTVLIKMVLAVHRINPDLLNRPNMRTLFLGNRLVQIEEDA